MKGEKVSGPMAGPISVIVKNVLRGKTTRADALNSLYKNGYIKDNDVRILASYL